MTTSVVGVMEMGKIMSGAGIKTTSLAFWVSVLIITPHWLPVDVMYKYVHDLSESADYYNNTRIYRFSDSPRRFWRWRHCARQSHSAGYRTFPCVLA